MTCIEEAISRQELRELTESYFSALDDGDEAGVVDTFAADAIAVYQTGSSEEVIISGYGAMKIYFSSIIENTKSSIHTICNFRVIDLMPDTAKTVTFCTAHLASDRTMRIRGLSYRDDHVKIAGKWRIGRRIHTALWEYEARRVEPAAPH
jgi:hypothetical protein